MRWTTIGVCLLAAGLVCVSPVSAKRKHHHKRHQKKTAAQIQLNATGQKLVEQYAGQLTKLRAQIQDALPQLDAKKKAAFIEACREVKTAQKNLQAAHAAFGELNKARGLIHHAHWWVRDSQKKIAKAKAALKKAASAADRKALEATIDQQTARRDAGEKAMIERVARLKMAEKSQPTLSTHLKAAEAALAKADEDAIKALDALEVKSLLSSDKMDASLVRFEVLAKATPRGLAVFAQQGARQQSLVKQLLSDTHLMKQMVVADGPAGNRYGRAMEIYSDIQKTSPKAGSGCLQRLALAVALVHAEPVKQTNAQADSDDPPVVNPVKRYLAFEKAYVKKELDPGFGSLTTWDYRFVVDGDEPNWMLNWGRKMLRNYRPDEVGMRNYRWRYVESVRSEVQYGSQHNKLDLPSLQKYQNIIKDGGVCGRRAFFGRFILRCFGIPTTARPEHGHASLVHWTPTGWVECLGASWGHGWTKTRYKDDRDFRANTRARTAGEAYLQVKRAQWIGDVSGETPVYGLHGRDSAGFWYAISLYRQREIIAEAKSQVPTGPQLQAPQSEEPGKIAVTSRGVIHIPAAACGKPTSSTGKIRLMASDLGGMQLHYARLGAPQTFEYTFAAPAAGQYELTARVVTTSQDQHLQVTTNGSTKPSDLVLPYTMGMWKTTQPVVISLVKGRNVLSFTRGKQSSFNRGITIKDFTLTAKQAGGK